MIYQFWVVVCVAYDSLWEATDVSSMRMYNACTFRSGNGPTYCSSAPTSNLSARNASALNQFASRSRMGRNLRRLCRLGLLKSKLFRSPEPTGEPGG